MRAIGCTGENERELKVYSRVMDERKGCRVVKTMQMVPLPFACYDSDAIFWHLFAADQDPMGHATQRGSQKASLLDHGNNN